MSVVWTEVFQISEEEIDRIQQTMPGDVGLIFHFLLNGRIDELTYLRWAANIYQLPFLQQEFFQQPPPTDLWDQYKHHDFWRRDFFPLIDWDGVVFIGCVEPPTDFHWNTKHNFILAQATHLSQWWQKLAPSVPASTSAVKNESADAPKAEFDGPQGLNFSGYSMEETTAVAPEAEDSAAETNEPPSFETPQGLNLAEMKMPDFNFNSPKAENKSVPTPKAPAPVVDETVTEKMPTLSAPVSFDRELTNTKFPLAQPNLDPNYDSTTVVAPVLKEKIIPVQTPPQASPIKASVVPAKSENAGGSPLKPIAVPAPASFDRITNEEEMAAYGLNSMKKHFSHSMFLQFKSGMLRPWKWSEGWQPQSERALEPIDVANPSIFRVVVSTKLPYHGHVVDNPINKYFFDQWNGRSNPNFVTLFPIVVTGKLELVLLGIGTADIQPQRALIFMTRLSEEICELTYRFRPDKAA